MSKTFVLVHGAFTGGWCWRHVRDRLTAEGHKVFTPTLTGVGERHHLASPDTSIETQIADIIGVIEAEELSDVILVGHSSSGVLAAAVADRLGARIRRLVFLDSSVPDRNGFELKVPPPLRASLVDGYLCSPPPLAMQGVPEDHPAAAWYGRRRTSMPLGVAEGAVTLGGSWRDIPATYIACTAGAPNPHAVAAMEKAGTFGIPVVKLAATHAAMATAPDELADLLTTLD